MLTEGLTVALSGAAVFRDGQQAAQSAAQQPQATFKSVMSDGQRAAENLSGSAQQGMEGVRSTLGSVAQQVPNHLRITLSEHDQSSIR